MDFTTAFDPVRALKSSWRMLWHAPLTLFLGGIILLLTESSNGSYSVDDNGIDIDAFGEPIVWWVGGCVCLVVLVLLALRIVVSIGFASAIRRIAATGEQKVGDLFDPRGLFFEMLFAKFLKVLIHVATILPLLGIVAFAVAIGRASGIELLGVFIGLFALAFLPAWIYIGLGISLTTEAVAFEGLSPIEALKRSWQLVDGNRLQLLLYNIVLAIVSFCGVCFCFVGLFVTAPLAYTAEYESYMRLTSGEPNGDSWLDREL